MSFAKLIHLAGLVSVFAGALIALAEILHPAGEDLACFFALPSTPNGAALHPNFQPSSIVDRLQSGFLGG